MKIKTYANETDVAFTRDNLEHACIGIRFPDNKNWILFVDRAGEVTWFNEKTDELLVIGQVPLKKSR